jgi:hypothetical protein
VTLPFEVLSSSSEIDRIDLEDQQAQAVGQSSFFLSTVSHLDQRKDAPIASAPRRKRDLVESLSLKPPYSRWSLELRALTVKLLYHPGQLICDDSVHCLTRKQQIMSLRNPPNAEDVQKILEERLHTVETRTGLQESVTIEWRGTALHIPVITMPVDLLHYNPDTHRIRAQRSIDPVQEQELATNPYSPAAQSYLHQLLMGDPTDPSKVDPSFIALKDDLKAHGQREPGIVTRAGVLVNGNTRQAALKGLGLQNIRVGVLPPDTGHADLQSIELSLQLRKDHRREYSFMNFLLAVDERAAAGQPAAKIQEDFHIKATSYERSRWILEFVRDAISRSQRDMQGGNSTTLRLVHFESHQGKLEELYRAYMALKATSSDQAESLREQRLMALLLDKSKTDLRLIEADFVQRYMKTALADTGQLKAAGVKIPGTSITVSGPGPNVLALRSLTTKVLQAKSIALNPGAVEPGEAGEASNFLGELNESLVKALDHAGKQVRVQKRRLAAADRLSDACDDIDLAVSAVAEARATGNFDPTDLDEVLLTFKSTVYKLSAIVNRNSDSSAEGLAWIRAVAKIGFESS